MNSQEEAIIWAYRLFLDRDPENLTAIADKLTRLESTRDIRREFVSSVEFKQKNPGFHTPALSGKEPSIHIENAKELKDLFFHIQNVWEFLGEKDPYWSVLTWEEFKSSNIEGTRTKFYKSGLNDATTLFNTLERNGIDYAPLKTCLEYGCGLGRVTYWLAKRFETVAGFDISRAHLRIAGQYLEETGVRNVSLHHISKPQDIGNFSKVDVVYSMIVLQHNPPPMIHVIIQELLRALNPGGIAFFQVPTYRLGYRFSLQEYLSGQVNRKEMEMHVFPQSEIFKIVSHEGCQMVEVLEDGRTGFNYGERSNTFVIRKTMI